MDFTASLARTKMIKRILFQKLKLKSLTSPEKKKAELQKNYRRPKKSIRGKNIAQSAQSVLHIVTYS